MSPRDRPAASPLDAATRPSVSFGTRRPHRRSHPAWQDATIPPHDWPRCLDLVVAAMLRAQSLARRNWRSTGGQWAGGHPWTRGPDDRHTGDSWPPCGSGQDSPQSATGSRQLGKKREKKRLCKMFKNTDNYWCVLSVLNNQWKMRKAFCIPIIQNLHAEGCLKYFTLFTSVWFNITNCLINYVLYMFYTLSSMENYLTNIKISLQKFQDENVSTLYFKFYIIFKILIFLWNVFFSYCRYKQLC